MILVALDADPNEDEETVLNYADENSVPGRFAIAPAGMTEALVADFGPTILAVSTAPIVLIDAEQQSPRLLRNGVKSAEELAQELGL